MTTAYADVLCGRCGPTKVPVATRPPGHLASDREHEQRLFEVIVAHEIAAHIDEVATR